MTFHRVDRESVAEQAGLQVGDLILDVNGTSFESIPHQEAVDFVKSQQHIIMTVKVSLTSLCLSMYMLIWYIVYMYFVFLVGWNITCSKIILFRC